MSRIIKPYVEEVLTMNLKTHPTILRHVENWLAGSRLLVERWDADGGRHWRLRFRDDQAARRFLAAYQDILRIVKGPNGQDRNN